MKKPILLCMTLVIVSGCKKDIEPEKSSIEPSITVNGQKSTDEKIVSIANNSITVSLTNLNQDFLTAIYLDNQLMSPPTESESMNFTLENKSADTSEFLTTGKHEIKILYFKQKNEAPDMLTKEYKNEYKMSYTVKE